MAKKRRWKKRCKAIAKSTGERCRQESVEKGLCHFHRKDDDGNGSKVEKGLRIGYYGTQIIDTLIDIFRDLPFLMETGDTSKLKRLVRQLEKGATSWDRYSARDKADVRSAAKTAVGALRAKKRAVKKRALKKKAVQKHAAKKRA